MYSRILLMWHTQDLTSDSLSSIPDYQTVRTLTYILTGAASIFVLRN